MKDNRKLIQSAANHCRYCRVKADLRDEYSFLVFIIRVVPREELSSLFFGMRVFLCSFF